MNGKLLAAAAAALLLTAPARLPGQAPPSDPRLSRTEAVVPTRDGVRLHTAVYAPREAREPLPFILLRTPYGIDTRAERALRSYLRDLVDEGYLFAFQDVRGRFKSGGRFVMMRPPRDAADPKAVDEASDTRDTIDWLLANVKGHNGRVGMLGVSYDGWLTAAAMLDPHPALKAASPQASPADMFLGDDFHHNGAFRLSYGFEYVAMMETDKENAAFPFDRRDTYEWYLNLGALSNVNARHFGGKRPTWDDFVAHPDYDDFWKRQSLEPRLNKVTVPTLNVAGWFDQEDFRGPLKIYELLERHDAKGENFLVVGPWNHGGWRDGPGDRLGKVAFDAATGKYFRQKVQAPFFAYHLKGRGKADRPEALMFQTGANRWIGYDRWPPKGATPRKLYFHPGGKLAFEPPARAESAFDAYRSDPANPVPYRPRPVTPTYPGREWKEWMVEDQRFTHHRPDVLAYESEPLAEDVVVAGSMTARLFASTSGTDCDWVVRLIDVYPEDYADDPEMGGFQLLVAGEPFRARYRRGFERPQAVEPGRVEEYAIDLHWGHHRFRKGHRVMVQVSSTWFPLIDRNPQKYVPNIFEANDSDFQPARQRVYRSPEFPSHLLLETLPAAPAPPAGAAAKEDLREALWAAVRDGDAKAAAALLDRGADVNAASKIGVTALWIAASRGKVDVVELLVRRGADVNARDAIWYQTPLSSAAGEGNAEVVKLLVRSGARGVEEVVVPAAAGGNVPVLQALLEGGKVRQEVLDAALIAAPSGGREVLEALQKAGATAVKVPPEQERAAWAPLAGSYENENGGRLTVELIAQGLVARRSGFPHLLRPSGPDAFRPVGLPATCTFVRKGMQVDRVVVKYHTSEITYYRLETRLVATPAAPPREEGAAPVAAPLNWPSFRGPDASGVADGQRPPLTWDVKTGDNVRWKTPIPGLGHSCPVVWGDRVFVTTAVSGEADPKVRVGNYGDVGSVDDAVAGGGPEADRDTAPGRSVSAAELKPTIGRAARVEPPEGGGRG